MLQTCKCNNYEIIYVSPRLQTDMCDPICKCISAENYVHVSLKPTKKSISVINYWKHCLQQQWKSISGKLKCIFVASYANVFLSPTMKICLYQELCKYISVNKNTSISLSPIMSMNLCHQLWKSIDTMYIYVYHHLCKLISVTIYAS